MVLAVAATATVIYISSSSNVVGGPLPAVARLVMLACPAAIALVGLLSRRRDLVAVAGVACLPLVVLSVVTLPILVGAVLLIHAGDLTSIRPGKRARAIGTMVVAAAIEVFCIALLVSSQTSYTLTRGRSSESGSYTNPLHAWVIIAVTSGALAVAGWSARRGRSRDVAEEAS